MAVDGYLNFNTKIDTNGFNSGTKQISSGVSSMKSMFSKLGKTIVAAFAVDKLVDFGKQAVEMASDLQEVQNVVDVSFGSMSSKMEEFADIAIETYGISKLTAKQTGSTYMAMAKGMGIAQEAASDMSLALTGLSADMASFYNKDQATTATALNSVFTGETETLKQFGIVMTETNLEAFALSQGITKAIDDMNQAEKVQLRYAYVMQQTALAQGDFARTSDGWANQTRILSEQWKEFMGIVGQALMQILLPAVRILNQAMGSLISVAQSALQTLSDIFGWELENNSANAVEGISDALSGAVDEQEALTEAAEEYKNQLMGFDKINKLSDSDDKDDSDGSFDSISVNYGSGTALNVDTSSAEAELSGFAGKAADIADSIKEYFDTNFSESWKDIWGGLKEETFELFDTFEDIFSDIKSLGAPLKKYFKGEFTSFISTSFAEVGNIAVGLFDTFNTVFSDIWNLAVFPMVSSFIENGLPTLTEFCEGAVSLFGTLFDEAKEIFDLLWNDAVAPVLTFVSDLWDDLMQSISDAWEKWGEPIFEGLEQAISETGEIFQTLWDTTLKPVWDNLMDIVDEVWDEHLKPFVDNFLDLVGTIVDGALDIYNEFILPVVEWFSKTFGPAISEVFNFVADTVGNIIKEIIDIGGSLIDSLKGIIDFIVGVFTGDWERAWEGIKQFFKGIWDALVGIVKIPINLIIDLVNGLTGAVEKGLNWIIDGINSLSFDVPEWVPGIGGETFGFDIDDVDIPKIPHLATGHVIPANYGEFFAVLGDNKRETEVVSPLSTIKQAVSEVVAQIGGTENINLTVELDGDVVYRKVVTKNKQNTKITGVNALA